jgi:hypothetical protein
VKLYNKVKFLNIINRAAAHGSKPNRDNPGGEEAMRGKATVPTPPAKSTSAS